MCEKKKKILRNVKDQISDTHAAAVVVLSDHLWVLFPDVAMVIASEIAVDVVKHAFITKFNDISADVSAVHTKAEFHDMADNLVSFLCHRCTESTEPVSPSTWSAVDRKM